MSEQQITRNLMTIFFFLLTGWSFWLCLSDDDASGRFIGSLFGRRPIVSPGRWFCATLLQVAVKVKQNSHEEFSLTKYYHVDCS